MINRYPLFVDCGAPSLYNKLSRKVKTKVMGAAFADHKYNDYSYTETEDYISYRNSYINFINLNHDHVTIHSNLDVIGSADLTYRNQKFLERRMPTPIPVFHLGGDEKWLQYYVEHYDYIALGGMNQNSTAAIIPILDHLWRKYILDEKGFPKVKVHGFAATSVRLMVRYPWYSVDSASCRKLGNFGKIALPNQNRDRLHMIFVSNRDMPLDFRLGPAITAEIEKQVGAFGFTLDEIVEDSLSRVIWNYMAFLNSVESVPLWPWSMYTQKSKKGASERMILYFAGSLSKLEEKRFWDELTQKKTDHTAFGRLHSFFYPKATQYYIDNYMKG